jgi:preprotein translocase subunit SecF
VIYLSIAFEWRMAVAAFIALIHDIVITTGVYALTGFTVSPTSVIGLLTILGYSLYDTVVVFDKVRENTAGLLTTQKSSYSDAANLALNQTLVRSINTSLTALLPVASILFVGAGLLGAGTLKDLSLVLFVGMLSGTYSSIFIATPVLADLKERQPEYRDLAAKVARRVAGGRSAQRAGGTASPAESASTGAASATAPAAKRPASTASGPVTASVVNGPGEPDDLAAEPTEAEDSAEDQETDDDVAVSAAAGRQSDSTPRAVTRQQRVTGGTQRRPGTRKKRR